jgi:hypothetical protein
MSVAELPDPDPAFRLYSRQSNQYFSKMIACFMTKNILPPGFDNVEELSLEERAEMAKAL